MKVHAPRLAVAEADMAFSRVANHPPIGHHAIA